MSRIESLLELLDSQQEICNKERSKLEKSLAAECAARMKDFEKRRAERLKYTATTVNSLNTITAHKNTITKVVERSEKHIGLPISHEFHKETRECILDINNFIGQQRYSCQDDYSEDYFNTVNSTNKVRCCTQSYADALNETIRSVDKVDALMNNMPVLINTDDDEDKLNLDDSIFYS